jgi:PAS domain S-box-containing protein
VLGATVLERYEWLRLLWEQTSEAMALSDAAGIVLAANPAYYKLYGYEPEEVLGKSFALIFPTDQQPNAEAVYREIFGAALPPPVVQSTVRSKDGSDRVVESRVSFVEADGQRLAMLSIIRDITDEIAARNDAARAQHDLRAFLFSLSHDIKSPLSVIKGHAQVMRRQLGRSAQPPPRDGMTDALLQIEASALRVADLVDELVEVATIQEGGAVPLHRSALDFVSVVRESVERHQRLADGHRFIFEAIPETLPGQWDGPRLGRVLDNLLGNAVKYSPEGGPISVRVDRGQRLAAQDYRGGAWMDTTDGCSNEDVGVLLSVEDHGIGITGDDLPHVFERFHRGCNVPQTVVGSGIGLTSVAQIVDQHGGQIAIASEIGSGTRVTIWLPVCQSDPAVKSQ